MHDALKVFFEEQVHFRLGDEDRTPIDGSVFIGDTEFLPVETLRQDLDAYNNEFINWYNEVWLPELRERRDEILKLHANRKRFADLCDACNRGQVIPLVGSGMSVPSGLPTWSDLLQAIRCFADVEPDDLNKRLSASEFEEAADLLANATNSRLFNERLEHELRLDDAASIGGAVRLLPAIFNNIVITTNLDNVLERIYGACGCHFEEVLAGDEISVYRSIKSVNGRILLKLHGDCRRPETRVLRTCEYDRVYVDGGTVREELSLLFRNHNILFLGCSLGPDRTVRLIEDVARADKSMPKHYAFIPLPRSESERLKREIFLTERGVFPIWYDGPHDECILALLAKLYEAVQ